MSLFLYHYCKDIRICLSSNFECVPAITQILKNMFIIKKYLKIISFLLSKLMFFFKKWIENNFLYN